ncbi:MAG: DinB family protein [Spirochaetaceae bacterium]|nr:DinB family protein [Spirochaetaceae bacterium]
MSERSEPHSKSDESVREHAADLLSGHGAHLPFERAVADVPEHLRGVIPEGAASSLWQQLEHLRIAQWDIVEFSRDPSHVSPEFPDGYWPDTVAPPAGAWQRSVDAFLADRDAMVALIRDPRADLYRRIPHGTGQTLLREALVLADHNAYHVGQIVLLRRLLGCW